MSLEQARTRLEEARTRVKIRVEEIRGGKSILGGSSGGNPFPTIEEIRAKVPTIEEIRAKGVLSVLEEKFPKVKEIRQKGVLARFLGKSGGQEPRKEAAIAGEEEVSPRARRRGAIAA